MKYSITTLLLFSSLLLSAQFGFSGKYNLNNFNSWNDSYQESNIGERPFRTTIDVGANYWFRLKNQRIEFLPELTYTLTTTDNISIQAQDDFSADFTQFGFRLNTHIYFMDLENDCNCPTFSKQGNFIPKALHLILSPGLQSYNTSLDVVNEAFTAEKSGLAFNMGIGLGLDIGVNDLLTITPFFLLDYARPYSSEILNQYADYSCDFACDLIQIENASNFHPQFGIRIGFRPDYLKENRYR